MGYIVGYKRMIKNNIIVITEAKVHKNMTNSFIIRMTITPYGLLEDLRHKNCISKSTTLPI